MTRRKPPALLTYHCKTCGAIVALMAPGAIVYDTQLQCPGCQSMLRIVKTLDNERLKEYHIHEAIMLA
jgi:DNA-directed RNA polymerase subunit RPC12/RpoP